jgi:hypothetical protein
VKNINLRRQLAGLLLTVMFICFTISGLVLINLTFTIAPFAIYGQPVQITFSVGAILILLALIAFVLLLRGKGEKHV